MKMQFENPFKKKKVQEEGIKIITEDKTPPKNVPVSTNYPPQKEETQHKKEETQPENKGLREQVGELNEKLDLLMPQIKESKMKPFKLPWGIKAKLKNLHKTNSVLVFFLRTDRTIKPMIAKIENGLIFVNEKWHNCSVDFVFLWLGKHPAIVLCEWDLDPVGTSDYYDARQEGRNVEAQTVIIRAIEQATIDEKKKMSPMIWIWVAIGAIVVGYIFFAGQKK